MKRKGEMSQALFLGVIFLFVCAFVGNVFVGDAKAQSCIQPPEGMVSWWPGDGNADDIVGGNHGTLWHDTTFAPGKVGEAFSFDGEDGKGDTVRAAGTGIDDLQELTIDAWVKLNSRDEDQERFVTLTGEKAVLRHDGQNSLGQLHFYMRFDQHDDYHHIRVNDVLGVGIWYHVAGTYDGNVMRLYLDGVEVGSLAVTGTVYTGSAVELSSEAEPMNGLLDEVEIFSRALSADEISAIYNAGSAGKCNAATVALIKAVETINELDPTSFKNKNLGNALTNKINAALAMIDERLYAGALHKLQHDILQKTNGCADTGEPDKNDWIMTCEGQDQVYPLILQAIEFLEKLI